MIHPSSDVLNLGWTSWGPCMLQPTPVHLPTILQDRQAGSCLLLSVSAGQSVLGYNTLLVCLLQEEQLHAVRSCLEAALQLLSRVGSLGPIEAFFSADELLAHYQWRLDATHALLNKIGAEPNPCCPAVGQHSAAASAGKAGPAMQQPQPAADGRQRCSQCQLQLPPQQQQIVHRFRRQVRLSWGGAQPPTRTPGQHQYHWDIAVLFKQQQYCWLRGLAVL